MTWAATSTSTEARMAKAKEVPSDPVKKAVWVRNPGPMAEVAIRKAAPARAPASSPRDDPWDLSGSGIGESLAEGPV